MQQFSRKGIIALLFLFGSIAAFSQGERPKIGLTLSGGGAKGMAHIGLLKAIDSAGIHVDYVTGTSMGAVCGGLYAAGYSGDEILEITKTLDWTSLLSNDLPMSYMNMREKQEFGHYIELPLNKGKLSLKRGLIESTELWLALNELYFPYYQTTDFSNFHRGFHCVATNVGDGQMVVLKQGDIAKSVRASMAIPSIFTPVEIDGKLLIDGGLTRNFPVANVKEMGADIVIGSDVSGDIGAVDEIKSPLDIVSRLPFFGAVSDLEQQKKLVNIYTDYPLGTYGTASFGSTEEIIQIGIKKGRELYPILKRMKDSLDAIYGKQDVKRFVRKPDSVFVSDYEIIGLPERQKTFFSELIGFKPNRYYTAKQLNEDVRGAYAIHRFTKINYHLVPASNNSAKIIFEVDEAASTAARFGANYNTAVGIGIKVGLVKRGFLSPYSLAVATLSLGENQRGKASYTYFTGKQRKLALKAETNFEVTDINTYNENFKRTGLYEMASLNLDFQGYWQPQKNLITGLGTTISSVAYEPEIISQIQAKGNVAFVHSYVFMEKSTLNALLYPTKGHYAYIRAGLIYGQKPDFSIFYEDELIGTEDDPLFDSHPYTQVRMNFEQYFPLGRHSVFGRVQSGINFNYKQILMNDFRVGGLNNVVRNQITFAGLPEAALFSPSVVSAQIGYRHAFTNMFFVTGTANALWYDFVKNNLTVNRDSNGFGCAVTAGLKTFLGPVEASIIYSDMNKEILPYFNVGYALTVD